MTSAITVPFHGAELYIVECNGQPYTPMKPIIEGMGLDWAAQFTKLKQRFAQAIAEIAIPSSGGIQSMICLPVRKLFGWLMTISANKVRPELRDTIIKYQNECDDVLWDYWTKGQAINHRAAITPEQQAELHKIVDRRAQGNRKIYASMWSRHNRHFNIAKYSQLLQVHFDDAKKLLTDMELTAQPAPKLKAEPMYACLASEVSLLITSQLVPLLAKNPDASEHRFFVNLNLREQRVYAKSLIDTEMLIDVAPIVDHQKAMMDMMRSNGMLEVATFFRKRN